MFNKYDIIVVGAGHAGCEAAAAAANMGSKVLLATMNMGTIGQMSCNPAIGGVAKGQIVREVDALGGYTGRVTDKTMVQFRMLNRSKGPAVHGPRSQADRSLYKKNVQEILLNQQKIRVIEGFVDDLIIDNQEIKGVVLNNDKKFFCS